MRITTAPVLTTTLGIAVSLCLMASSLGVSAAGIDSSTMAVERKYTTPHSYGKNYVFSARDGWELVNTTNLYKSSDTGSRDDTPLGAHSNGSHLETRARRPKPPKPKAKSSSKVSSKSVTRFSSLSGSLKKIMDSIKGVGKPEPVIITWYTGHDLLNPSCWPTPIWAPTDESFVAALTLDGWTSKPKCFKFLELCHTSEKCVFVRVVDSCAGCAKGSKHVDLTQAAFGAMIPLDTGMSTVQMRHATDPDEWSHKLWGPQIPSKD